ncbi:hypothetical protein HK405_002067, partial [Cladochytrium tenue]
MATRRSARTAAAATAAGAAPSTSDCFTDLVFTMTPGVDRGLAADIVGSGGSIVQSVTKKLTHLITTPEDVAKTPVPAKLRDARARGDVSIVSAHFITDSVAAGRLAD